MSSTSRPRTRSQRRQAELDLDQNNDDSDISADGFEPETIKDELDAVRHDISVLSAGDRRKLDQFLAAQETFIIQLKGYQINYHFFNNMTVSGIEKWAKNNIKSALVAMNKSTRKQDKITALMKTLKAARADIRDQHDQLKRFYVDNGMEEHVLLGARRVLSENNENGDDNGSDLEDRYNPDDDEDQDDDVDGLNMNMNNNNSARKRAKRGKGNGKGDIGNGKNNENKNNKDKEAGKRNKGKDKNKNKNNNNNENEEKSDNKKGDDIDMNNIFKDLPPTFQAGLANFIRNAWNGHAAASGLQGAPAPGFVADQVHGIQGGGSVGGNGSKLDKNNTVPPEPEKQFTKDQIAARRQVAQLLKGAPRSRDKSKPAGGEEEKGDIQLDLDDLLSEDDDDDETIEGNLTSKEDKRVDMAIRQMREKTGCTYDQAVQKLLTADVNVLLGSKISKHKIKKYDISTALGRKKFSIDLFRQVADKCPRQQDFLDLLKVYHGEDYTRDQAIRKCFEYRWPDILIPLYILKIGKFEILKIENKYSNDKGKMEKLKLKYYENLCESFLPCIFWDSLFKNSKEDLRLHVLESLYLLVDKTRNVPIKSFDKCYMVDRARLLSGHGEVVTNYVTNYSNKLGKKSGKQLVRIPKFSSGSGTSNSNNNTGGGQTICRFFNSKSGCNRGSSCKHKHVCYKCGESRHGIEACFKLCRILYNNGILNEYLSNKRVKIVPIDAIVSTGSSSGGTVRPPPPAPKGDAPPRKRQRQALTQCVQGVDGNWYPVSS